MTAPELAAKARVCGPQELPVFLHFLADHWYDLRLIGGGRLTDVIDSATALRELAEAFRHPEHQLVALAHSTYPDNGNAAFKMSELPPRKRTCGKCFHVHEKDDECGVDLGKGGICDCRVTVNA